MPHSLVFSVNPGITTQVFRLPPFRWWQIVSGAQNGEVLKISLQQNGRSAQYPDLAPGGATPVNVAFDEQNTVLLLQSDPGGNHAEFSVFLNLIL